MVPFVPTARPNGDISVLISCCEIPSICSREACRTLFLLYLFTRVHFRDIGLTLARSAGDCARALSRLLFRRQCLEEFLKSAGIILPEVHVLQAAQPKRNHAIPIDDWDDDFLFLQRERNFVHDIVGIDRGRRENRQHVRAVGQSIFDGAVPTLTRNDVQLIQLHTRATCLQVSGEPKGELGIFTAIAEKHRCCVLCHDL